MAPWLMVVTGELPPSPAFLPVTKAFPHLLLLDVRVDPQPLRSSSWHSYLATAAVQPLGSDGSEAVCLHRSWCWPANYTISGVPPCDEGYPAEHF